MGEFHDPVYYVWHHLNRIQMTSGKLNLKSDVQNIFYSATSDMHLYIFAHAYQRTSYVHPRAYPSFLLGFSTYVTVQM